MSTFNLYADVAKRTGGDIYIGVVGPVRTGKSTFISSFIKNCIVPEVTNEYEKTRIIDDMPQSADGKVVMTTQPKFVPGRAVKLTINEQIEARFRLVDCVGYMINGADSGSDNGIERNVKTPWGEEDIPFSKAAEIGTKKVITEHSTVGIVLTTDGSIKTGIARPSYIEAEERCIAELKALKKPFVVVINSAEPNSEECQRLKKSIEAKHEVSVIALNAAKLSNENLNEIFRGILSEFPLKSVEFKLPSYLEALPANDPFVKEVIDEAKQKTSGRKKINDYQQTVLFEDSENFEATELPLIKMDEGKVYFVVKAKPSLFYRVVSSQVGFDVADDFGLVSCLKELSDSKKSYDRVRLAMDEAMESGYGISMPDVKELSLEEPEILKQGGRFGVRLKATAPCLHIVKVDIETEVNPILGTEQASEQMVKEMMEKFENNKSDIWATNIFGKSLDSLAIEGLSGKVNAMPESAKVKLRKTTSKIVNEGKGGMICILL